MLEKPTRPTQPDIQERQAPRTIQEILDRYDLDNIKIYEYLESLIDSLEEEISHSGGDSSADIAELRNLLQNKVDKVSGMGLSHNDLTDALKTKIENSGTSNFSGAYNDLSGKPSINGVSLGANNTLASLGIQPAGNYALASDLTSLSSEISGKVDKVTGMGLSHNDLTDELKSKIQNAGTSNFSGAYADLTGKPSINGVTLGASNTLANLGIQPAGNYASSTAVTALENELHDEYQLKPTLLRDTDSCESFIDDNEIERYVYEYSNLEPGIYVTQLPSRICYLAQVEYEETDYFDADAGAYIIVADDENDVTKLNAYIFSPNGFCYTTHPGYDGEGVPEITIYPTFHRIATVEDLSEFVTLTQVNTLISDAISSAMTTLELSGGSQYGTTGSGENMTETTTNAYSTIIVSDTNIPTIKTEIYPDTTRINGASGNAQLKSTELNNGCELIQYGEYYCDNNEVMETVSNAELKTMGFYWSHAYEKHESMGDPLSVHVERVIDSGVNSIPILNLLWKYNGENLEASAVRAEAGITPKMTVTQYSSYEGEYHGSPLGTVSAGTTITPNSITVIDANNEQPKIIIEGLSTNNQPVLEVSNVDYKLDFLIGANGVNRGIYDRTQNFWVLFRDANHTYLNSNEHNIYFRPNNNGTNLSYQASDGTWHMGGTILPSSNLSYNLGTPSYAFNRLYVNNIYAKGMGGEIISGSNASNLYIGTGSDLNGKTTNIRGNTVRLYAHTSGAVYLGYSGSTAVTSDENLKNIYDLDDKYLDFFMHLKPISYVYKDNGHRNHLGFGARQVEQALLDADLTTEDFAGVLIDKDVTIGADEAGTEEDVHYDELYSLRYEEFIALNTAMIQKQAKIIEEQQKQINDLEERISKLEKGK